MHNTQSNKNFNIRHGAMAQKVGMTSIWHNGVYTPVTLLKINSVIFGKKTLDKDGYNAIVVSYGNANKITKPQAGVLNLITGSNKKNDVSVSEKIEIIDQSKKNTEVAKKDTDITCISKDEFLKVTEQEHLPAQWKDLQYKKVEFNKLKEFRTDRLSDAKIGTKILAEHFQIGQLINVAGTSIGKGFAGGMKRHNFRGLEATHGVSVSHRSSGSTGQRQDPGKTFKGKKMPGHLGNVRCTIENLKVLGYYEKYDDILIVKGSIPGYNGCFVEVKDAVKS